MGRPLFASRSSTTYRVGGLSPSFSCPHVEVSMGKTLKHHLLPMITPGSCTMTCCQMCVWSFTTSIQDVCFFWVIRVSTAVYWGHLTCLSAIQSFFFWLQIHFLPFNTQQLCIWLLSTAKTRVTTQQYVTECFQCGQWWRTKAAVLCTVATVDKVWVWRYVTLFTNILD